MKLTELVCKNCGARLSLSYAAGRTIRCKYCGTANLLPREDEERTLEVSHEEFSLQASQGEVPCADLSQFEIENGVLKKYKGNGGEVDIPYGVTSIGEDAFLVCRGLTSIFIPDSVTSIGNNAFFCCSGLTKITIPNSVTSIGDCAFYFCVSLESITIPDSVTSIGDCAFANCSGLTEITIPDSVTSIGNGTFNSCSGLSNITIPGSVTSIGNGTFEHCSGLTNITIPFGVTSIGNSAFEHCSGLTNITIPFGVTSIGEHAFYGCSGLSNITIPGSVTSIGNSAFYGCSGLTDIIIFAGVTKIGDYAFFCCSGITSITIPDSVTSIGDCAFAHCSGLTSVTIPKRFKKGDPYEGLANIFCRFAHVVDRKKIKFTFTKKAFKLPLRSNRSDMKKVRIAVLCSGGGTNLQAILDAERAGKIPHGEVVLVVADSKEAYALRRAENFGVETAVFDKREYPRAEREAAILACLQERGAELVALAGFMTVLSAGFVKEYEGRILNIHPALLPSFGGVGMYGLHVHEAVLARGVKVTGATVHFVTEECDGGPILAQKAVEVMAGDTPETLQQRVMREAEWVIYPKAIEEVCKGLK